MECIPSVWSKQNGSTLKFVIQLNQYKDNCSTLKLVIQLKQSQDNGSRLKLVIQLNQNKDHGLTWAYIKVNKLLERLNKTMIQCHNTLQVWNTNNGKKNADKYMCTVINTNNSFL